MNAAIYDRILLALLCLPDTVDPRGSNRR